MSLLARPAPVGPPAGGWTERIVNADGTINWTEYANVANHYNRADILDYRLGPKYEYFHPAPSAADPQLWGPTADGIVGGQAADDFRNGVDAQDWYAMSGQLVFAPDANAATGLRAGVVRARNGSIYTYNQRTPQYVFDMRLSWTPDKANSYNTSPDPAVLSAAYGTASGGALPAPPVATVRAKGEGAVTGFLLYQNGVVGATGTGNDGYVGSGFSEPYVALKLPNGKVPTAGAATLNSEFLLVTVWDAANHKGQVAVIAVKGRVKAQETQWLYGFPSWPTVRGLKLLGFVDLPFAAPTSISVSDDLKQGSSRGEGENHTLDLNQQTERDKWYRETGTSNQKLAQSGYAVVASRAENKVCFVDLQPLFAYYRSMYLTTQANYDQTKNEGPADNQWPFAFAQVPGQTPVVVQTLTVSRPTAVVAGTPRFGFFWREIPGTNGDVFRENAYVASLDGTVRMYKVGGLNTTAAASAVGAAFNTFSIGPNPASVDYGGAGVDINDLFFACRGDRSVAYVFEDGTVHATLRDGRLQDPVYAAVAHNIRSSGNALVLSVMDFGGKQAVNYRYDNGRDTVPVGPNGNSVFEYGFATPVAGQPFQYTAAEVP